MRVSALPQAYGFEHLSPDGDTVLGGCGTFGRWGLTGESGFLGDRSLGLERGPISAQGVGFAGSTGMRTNNPSSHHYWPVPHSLPSHHALCSLKQPDKTLPASGFSFRGCFHNSEKSNWYKLLTVHICKC